MGDDGRYVRPQRERILMSSAASRILGARQRRFVDEYLIDCNGTRAAIAAGYTKRTAAQAAWEVLRNPKVADEVSRRQRLLAQRHSVTIENVISELAKIGFSNAADFYELDSAGKLRIRVEALNDPAKAAAISQVEVSETKEGGQVVKFKLFDKRTALGDLSRHLGFAPDRLEVTVASAKAPEDEPSNLDLALAVLALLADAEHEHELGASRPLVISGPNAEVRRTDEVSTRIDMVAKEPQSNPDDDDSFDLDA